MSFVPPYIKYKGFFFGPEPTWCKQRNANDGIVEHRVFVKEIEDQRAATGEDYNGALASWLANRIQENCDQSERNCADYWIRPYCWCEEPECPWCLSLEPNDPKDVAKASGILSPWGLHWDPAAELWPSAPNLWLKKEGLMMWWYKHAARGIHFNRPYKAAEIQAICARLGIKDEP